MPRLRPSGRSASPDSRKVVKWNVEDTFSWLRKDHSASKEDYMVSGPEGGPREWAGPHSSLFLCQTADFRHFSGPRLTKLEMFV